MSAMTDAPDLANLIASRKGKRSYERLSADCGGVLSGARLQQLATKPIKEFPEPATIRALAGGLGATVTEVVSAISRSLGLDVRFGEDPSALVIGGVGSLPDPAKAAVASVAREMLSLYVTSDDQEEVGQSGDAAPSAPAGGSPAQVVPFPAREPDPEPPAVDAAAARRGDKAPDPHDDAGEETQDPEGEA